MVPPGGLVVAEPWVHQGWFGAELSGRVPAGVDLVDGAPDPPGPAGADLVAHGVGQGLRGVVAGDGVAVVVEQGVERPEAEGAVTTQHGASGPAKGSTGHRPGVGLDRGQGRLTDGRRAAALLAGDDGPQLVSQLIGAAERRETATGDSEDLLLARVDVVEGLVSFDLELEAPLAGQAGPPAVGVEGAAGDRRVGLRAGARPGGGGGERLGEPVTSWCKGRSWPMGTAGLVFGRAGVGRWWVIVFVHGGSR